MNSVGMCYRLSYGSQRGRVRLEDDRLVLSYRYRVNDGALAMPLKLQDRRQANTGT